jgi:hypothetical protein
MSTTAVAMKLYKEFVVKLRLDFRQCMILGSSSDFGTISPSSTSYLLVRMNLSPGKTEKLKYSWVNVTGRKKICASKKRLIVGDFESKSH